MSEDHPEDALGAREAAPVSPVDTPEVAAANRSRKVMKLVVFFVGGVLLLVVVGIAFALFGADAELESVDAYAKHFDTAMAALEDSAKETEYIRRLLEEGDPESVGPAVESAQKNWLAALRVTDSELDAATKALADLQDSPEKRYLASSIDSARGAADELKSFLLVSRVTADSLAQVNSLTASHRKGDLAVNDSIDDVNGRRFKASIKHAKDASAEYKKCLSCVASLEKLQTDADFADARDVFVLEAKLAGAAQDVASAAQAGSRARYRKSINRFNDLVDKVNNERALPDSVTGVPWPEGDAFSKALDEARTRHEAGMTAYDA